MKPGSIVRAKDSLDINFILTDGTADVPVIFSGILPDLFAEGEAAVVNGMLNDKGVFKAEQVLAKHDENYTPPEVAEGMKNGVNDQAICKDLKYGS